MTGKERFVAAMSGKQTDVTAVMPKMWVDVAARVMNVDLAGRLGNPAEATGLIVDAAQRLGMDGARLLLFPHRSLVADNWGNLLHMDGEAHVVGKVDRSGGWKTCLKNNRFFDIENPEHIAHFHCYHSERQLVADLDDVNRLTIPAASYYETAGYGEIVAAALTSAGESLACVGDCNSGTLPLLAMLRGMMAAMMDLVDNPDLVHAIMEKGMHMALERAKFFVARGVSILRYNDSIANMTVISPDHFRQFVYPYIRDFCTASHGLGPDVKVYCHICGNVAPILPDLVASGLDCIAPLDPLGGFDLAQARQAAGGSVVLMGGVNTLSFIRSTPEEIADEARACMRSGSAGGGYILGSGCALPPDTKLDNLSALIETAHKTVPVDRTNVANQATFGHNANRINTAAIRSQEGKMEILIHSAATPARVQAAVLDFDGTLSTLRQGWETIMEPLMLEMIAGQTPIDAELIQEVRTYIDQSTGIQTFYQMQWLADTALKYGRNPRASADPWWYKAAYNHRLMLLVDQRRHQIETGQTAPDDFLIQGSVALLQALTAQGVAIYVASGTDHADVLRESELLGLRRFCTDIAGAMPQRADCSKDAVLRRLVDEHGLRGPEVVVIGDGKVEIALGRAVGARTLGVASDEILRCGINPVKRKRLIEAGAQALVGDFHAWPAILHWLGLTEGSEAADQVSLP